MRRATSAGIRRTGVKSLRTKTTPECGGAGRNSTRTSRPFQYPNPVTEHGPARVRWCRRAVVKVVSSKESGADLDSLLAGSKLAPDPFLCGRHLACHQTRQAGSLVHISGTRFGPGYVESCVTGYAARRGRSGRWEWLCELAVGPDRHLAQSEERCRHRWRALSRRR
jgi:hypothetical protein